MRPPFFSVLDSTIVSSFRACPQLAYQTYIRHYKPKTPSVHLHAGGAFAHGLEVGRTAYFRDGVPEQEAITRAITALLKFYGDFECPTDSAKSAERMSMALAYYFDAYPMSKDSAPPTTLADGRKGIEFSFAEPIDSIHPETGDPILYVGRMDMIVDFCGGRYGEDDKTTTSLGASWAKQWDMRSQFTGYCLTPDTEVLTKSGWKRIEHLLPGEAVMQWEKSGETSWTIPSAIHSPDYEGELVLCDGKVSFASTPDHRQVVWDTYSKKYKDYTSETLPKNSGALRFISAGKLKGSATTHPDFIRLLVAIQADGSWKDNGVRFHFSKNRKARRLEDILTGLGIPYNWHATEDWSVQISHELISTAKNLLGEDKKFGKWLLDLSGEDLQTFIEEVGYWDGSPEGSASGWMYFSTDKENTEWVRTVASLTGHYTSAHFQQGWKSDKVHHRVCIMETCHHSPHLHTWKSLDYKGKVYCLTVPSSYFLIRKKGQTMVTGNCWGAQQGGVKLDGFLVRGIAILKTKFDTQQAITYRPQWMIDRWYTQLLADVERMKQCWESGMWDYNLDHSCEDYGGCPLKSVCLSPDPERWLRTGFTRRVWDPVKREERFLPEES